MWTYEQTTGDLYDDNGRKTANGYSGGNCGKNPEAVNSPAFQTVRMVGPIPEGFYSIEAPRDDERLGPYVLDLTPDPANNMYGRSEFRMHGDNSEANRSASEGCIIMPRSMRVIVWMSNDHKLEVVV